VGKFDSFAARLQLTIKKMIKAIIGYLMIMIWLSAFFGLMAISSGGRWWLPAVIIFSVGFTIAWIAVAMILIDED